MLFHCLSQIALYTSVIYNGPQLFSRYIIIAVYQQKKNPPANYRKMFFRVHLLKTESRH